MTSSIERLLEDEIEQATIDGKFNLAIFAESLGITEDQTEQAWQATTTWEDFFIECLSMAEGGKQC